MEAKFALLEANTAALESEIAHLKAEMKRLTHYSKSSAQDVEFRDTALQQVRSL